MGDPEGLTTSFVLGLELPRERSLTGTAQK